MKKHNAAALPPEALPLRPFLKMALSIVLPVAGQNLINTLVTSADVIMLGFVSQTALAASSLANQIQLILNCIFFGLSAGVGILVAQYWGNGDTKAIERILGIGIRIISLIAFAIFLPTFFAPTWVMHIFTNDAALIEEGARYLHLMSLTYVMQGFTQMYLSVLRSRERVMLPLVTYVVSLGANVVLNATFIFGLFGAPKLGLIGVAIGTMAARIIETSICFIDSARCKDVKIRVSCIFGKGGALFRDILRLASWTFVNELLWSTAFATYSVIMGHLGSDAVAAESVVSVGRNLGTVLGFGFGSGTAIIVGKAISECGEETAMLYSRRMLWLTGIVGIIGALIPPVIRPFLLWFGGNLTPTASSYLNLMILFTIPRIWGMGINACWICGCFRAGGDARFGAICDPLDMWGFIIPLSSIAAFVLHLPVPIVYLIICMDELTKMPFVIRHYRKARWITNLTRPQSELE